MGWDSTTPFVLHLTQDLAAMGVRSRVLAPHYPGSSRHEVIDGVVVDRFRYLLPESRQTVCYDGGALINLRHRPMESVKLPALVAAELAATVRRLPQADLLHSHWALPQGWVGGVARRAVPRPHVLTVHGGDVFGLGGRLLARFKRAALEAADIVTVNSSATERAVLAWRLLFVVSSVSLWGVDLPAADPDAVAELRRRHRRGGGPLLAFAGRLVEEKGVGDVLRAVAQLTRELPDVTAVLAGAGQDRPAFERLAVELGVADRVTFLGWLAPETVPLLFAASDAVLAPSRTGVDGWKEAQGLAVAEALAGGRPVIASNVGGLPDHVIDGLTGLLVPEGTPAAVADAVRRLAADQQLAGRLGDAGRDHALRHLTRASTAARFRELYQELTTP